MKFCMVTLATILPALNEHDLFANLNLEDAYFHMATFPSNMKFLEVADQHYQYAVLPFGLSLALCIFTKCMNVVRDYLRRIRIHVFPYLIHYWLVRESLNNQVLKLQFMLKLIN